MSDFTLSLVVAALIGGIGFFGMDSINSYIEKNDKACSQYGEETLKTVFINGSPKLIPTKECLD